MRYGVLLLVVAAVLAVPAQAAAPGFQAQINKLKAQVVALQGGMKIAGSNDQVTRDWATCFHAQDQDTINAVWHVLNVSLAAQGYPAQPDIPRYDDGGACGRVGQTRIR